MEFTTAENLHALSVENRDTAAYGLGGPCSHSAHSLRISSALTLRYRAKPTAPPSPGLTSCYPLCLRVTILSSRPRGTLEGTEVENRSGKGTVLPFRWTGINGGEAHPEKSKLGVTDQPGSAPRLRGEAGGEVSGEARVWLASWQDGNPEGSSPPILALLPLHSSHSEGPTGRS